MLSFACEDRSRAWNQSFEHLASNLCNDAMDTVWKAQRYGRGSLLEAKCLIMQRRGDLFELLGNVDHCIGSLSEKARMTNQSHAALLFTL